MSFLNEKLLMDEGEGEEIDIVGLKEGFMIFFLTGCFGGRGGYVKAEREILYF